MEPFAEGRLGRQYDLCPAAGVAGSKVEVSLTGRDIDLALSDPTDRVFHPGHYQPPHLHNRSRQHRRPRHRPLRYRPQPCQHHR